VQAATRVNAAHPVTFAQPVAIGAVVGGYETAYMSSTESRVFALWPRLQLEPSKPLHTRAGPSKEAILRILGHDSNARCTLRSSAVTRGGNKGR
jgi:hypothetical protein